MRHSIAIGTYAFFSITQTHIQGTFSLLLPDEAKSQFGPFGVEGQTGINPGDHIYVTLERLDTAPDAWRILLIDDSINVSIDRTVKLPISPSIAEFIMVDPIEYLLSGPRNYAFAHFSPITLSNMQIRVGEVWTVEQH